MTRDICYKYLQNQLKIDQLFSLKSFKDTTIVDLVLEISRVYSRLLKLNKQEEAISDCSYDSDFFYFYLKHLYQTQTIFFLFIIGVLGFWGFGLES